MSTPARPGAAAHAHDLLAEGVVAAVDDEGGAGERLGSRWFRRVWEHAPAAVAVVSGPEHVMVYVNVAFTRLGAASETPSTTGTPSPAIGRPVAEALAPLGAAGLTTLLDAARRTGAPVRGTISIVGPAGHVDAWQCTAWPLAEAGDPATRGDRPVHADAADPTSEAAGGGPRRLVVVIDASSHAEQARARHRDVTERVLLSALREEDRADAADAARQGAERASAARGSFLAHMSHEIRTPLAAIGGYADIIGMGLRGPVTDGQRDALGRIQQAMRHLVGLTRTLLEQAKIEAGGIEYVITAVPVHDAIIGALTLVAPQAGAKGVALTMGPCDARLVARADADKLRQILLNLLSNAIKFTDAGGTVAVACETLAALDDTAARLALRVTDTGCGIAADQVARVFDPYVQVGRRADTGNEGVGLGLAISRDHARAMGGDVTVESTLGVGSTFTLRLPRA